MSTAARSARPGDVQLVTLAAALAWIALHTGHAIVFRDEHRVPALLAAALVLALTASAVALAPLFRQEEPELRGVVALGLAMAGIAVALMVQPFLTPQGLTGYANWPMGGLCVLIAALTLRHRSGAAGLVAVGLTAVNSSQVAGAAGDDPTVTMTDAVFLGVPPIAWWLGALVVRSMLDTSTSMAERYRRRQLELEAEAQVSRAVRRSDDERRAELRTRVMPLLTALADGSRPVDDVARADATRIALSLRDDLKARSLLTNSLRDRIAATRARGVWVNLSCDTGVSDDTAAGVLSLARAALLAVLPATTPGCFVTCRVTSRPSAAVVVVSGLAPGAGGRLAQAVHDVGESLPGSQLVVDELDDELVVQLKM